MTPDHFPGDRSAPAMRPTMPPATSSLMVAVEQQRAIAEVQAKMMIARSNPRDPHECRELVLADCDEVALAEVAVYEFARGGTVVTGPSVKLMQAIARRWGNLMSGVEELDRLAGFSVCRAYAWDLETGYSDERRFPVKHWRDTKGGGYPLKDERDIYELIANQGQRRKRACLETILPPELIEAAQRRCEATIKANADLTPEGIARLVDSFAAYRVTREQIEARIQRSMDAITPAQVVQLRRIWASLRDGVGTPADYFREVASTAATPAAAPTDEPVTGTARAREAVRAKRKPASEPPPPAAPPPEGEVDQPVDDRPAVSLSTLRAAITAAPSRDDALVALDRARELSAEEQEALRIVFEQRFGEGE